MARSGRRTSFVAGAIALALLAAPLPALAAFAINIQGPGGYNVTVLDGGAGDLTGPIPDKTIAVLAIIGTSLLTLDSAITNSPGGPLASPPALSSSLSLGWSLASAAGGSGTDTVTIAATAQGYAFPASGVASVLKSDVGGTAGSGSVVAQQWVDLSDGFFASAGVGPIYTPGSSLGPLYTPGPQGPFGPGPFSDSALQFFSSLTPYSITEQVILNLAHGSATSGSLESTVVPEPITMFLGGTGLLMLGYAGRKRLFGR